MFQTAAALFSYFMFAFVFFLFNRIGMGSQSIFHLDVNELLVGIGVPKFLVPLLLVNSKDPQVKYKQPRAKHRMYETNSDRAVRRSSLFHVEVRL